MVGREATTHGSGDRQGEEMDVFLQRTQTDLGICRSKEVEDKIGPNVAKKCRGDKEALRLT